METLVPRGAPDLPALLYRKFTQRIHCTPFAFSLWALGLGTSVFSMAEGKGKQGLGHLSCFLWSPRGASAPSSGG